MTLTEELHESYEALIHWQTEKEIDRLLEKLNARKIDNDEFLFEAHCHRRDRHLKFLRIDREAFGPGRAGEAGRATVIGSALDYNKEQIFTVSAFVGPLMSSFAPDDMKPTPRQAEKALAYLFTKGRANVVVHPQLGACYASSIYSGHLPVIRYKQVERNAS